MRLAVLMSAAALIAGCRNAGTAVRIEQRRVVGVTSTEIADMTVPIISIGEGPSVSAYQSKDAGSSVFVSGRAVTTNRTNVLWGMYDSDESKSLDFRGCFKVDGTNRVDAAK